MFEFLKKKGNNPNNPGKDDAEAEIPEVPDVDGTINDLDAALAKADRLKADKAREEQRERDRLRELERYSGSRCGCG